MEEKWCSNQLPKPWWSHDSLSPKFSDNPQQVALKWLPVSSPPLPSITKLACQESSLGAIPTQPVPSPHSCLADPRCIYHLGRKADEINLFKSVLRTVGAGKKQKILAMALSKSCLFGYLLPWFHTQDWSHVIWAKMQGSSGSKATKTKQRTQHLTFSSYCFVESCLGLFHSLKGW